MRIGMTIGVVLAAAGVANAAIVTQWNFNNGDASGTTGTTAPALGTGTFSALGVSTSFASGNSNGGSTDPETSVDDTGLQTSGYAAQGTGSGTRGVQFLVSTAGVFDGIYVTFDVRHSNTSSRYLQFEYTLDGGATWSSSNLTQNGAAFDGVFVNNSGDTWFNNRRVDLFDVAGAADNANFGFRVTAIFAPTTAAYASANSANSYATSGTLRYDMVTVQTPAPGAAALFGLGILVAGRRRR